MFETMVEAQKEYAEALAAELATKAAWTAECRKRGLMLTADEKPNDSEDESLARMEQEEALADEFGVHDQWGERRVAEKKMVIAGIRIAQHVLPSRAAELERLWQGAEKRPVYWKKLVALMVGMNVNDVRGNEKRLREMFGG